MRIRKDGHYHHCTKMTVIFAIKLRNLDLPQHTRGSIEHPWHWIKCLCTVGITTNIICDFCDHVFQDIEMNNIPGTNSHRLSFETILLHITASMFTILWQPMFAPAILHHSIASVPSKVWPYWVQDLQGNGENLAEKWRALGCLSTWTGNLYSG
jgi:hypothetical protein